MKRINLRIKNKIQNQSAVEDWIGGGQTGLCNGDNFLNGCDQQKSESKIQWNTGHSESK